MPILGMTPRIILHVDMDYFFAAVEEREHPDYKGKPVIVGADPKGGKGRGVVSTCNYTAREFGVRSGMPISRAWKLCPNAIYAPVNFELYRGVSSRIIGILRGYADKFEQVGIDEAFLDISQKVGNYEEAKELAQKIKGELLEKERLTCSIGIGPNKLISKIAANINKPSGLKIVKPESVINFLSPLPVRSLSGVGIKTEKKLESLGIKTMGRLAEYDVQNLIDVFGRKLGTYFHNSSIGIDEEPVKERDKPESISKIMTLKNDTKKISEIIPEINMLCSEVQSILLERKLMYRSVSIILITSNMKVYSRSRTIEQPTRDLGLFKSIVKELFEKFLTDFEVEIRRIGVKLSSLTKKTDKQKQITSFFINSN